MRGQLIFEMWNLMTATGSREAVLIMLLMC